MLILVSVKESALGGSRFMLEYKNICELSGDKVIDHLSNFYVTRIVIGQRIL